MSKNFLGSVALAAVLVSGFGFSAPLNAGVLAHQVKVQGELGSVFINPYDVSPLTAIIDRAGKDIKDIHVKVKGKARWRHRYRLQRLRACLAHA